MLNPTSHCELLLEEELDDVELVFENEFETLVLEAMLKAEANALTRAAALRERQNAN